jgi:hypothetical protein
MKTAFSHDARQRAFCVSRMRRARAMPRNTGGLMSKKNSGINDRHDASGEQSHIDGNSGLDNLIDGEALPDPPDQISGEEARELERRAKTPTRRKGEII